MSEEAPLRAAVLVLNWNGRDHLEACFESLGNLDTFAPGRPGTPRDPRLRDEVWLVDNGSTDDSIEYVRGRFPWVRVHANGANLGFSSGYNHAVKACPARCVAFLNNDTRVEPGWLSALLAARERHGAFAAASRIMSWNGRRIDFVGADTYFTGHAMQQHLGEPARGRSWEERPILFGCAGALLVDRRTFLAIGGFDPAYFSFFEDVDLGWRAALLGHETVFVPDAVTHHRLHGSWGDAFNVRTRFLVERNALFTVFKNYHEERMGVLVLAAAALALLRGWWLPPRCLEGSAAVVRADAVAHLLAIGDLDRCRHDLLRKRAAVQAARVRDDNDVLPLFGPVAELPMPGHTDYPARFARVRDALFSRGALTAFERDHAESACRAALALARLCRKATIAFLQPGAMMPDRLSLDRPVALELGATSALGAAAEAVDRALRAGLDSETTRDLVRRLTAIDAGWGAAAARHPWLRSAPPPATSTAPETVALEIA